jgi:hypothetical protein
MPKEICCTWWSDRRIQLFIATTFRLRENVLSTGSCRLAQAEACGYKVQP